MTAPPLFIALEGLDGAGTTTQGKCLERWLESKGREVHLTREPSPGPIGRLIKSFLKGHEGVVDPSALALLFAADRIDHLAREIGPALEAGQDVISDRFVLSSLAYQGIGGNLEWVRRLNERARPPHVTIFLDVPVDVCLDRLAARGDEPELFERRETLLAVHALYMDVLSEIANPADLLVVDGTLPIEAVTGIIARHLAPRT